MADNFDFTPGTGAVGAAKNVGGVLIPQVIATEIDGTDTGIAAKLGPVTETAPTTDTASSGINGRLQRISQRLSTLISGGLAVTGTFWQSVQPVSGTFWQTTQPVSASSLPLPTGAATDATLGSVLTTSDFDSKAGSLTETAPTTDTASSGLNGRLQRIAQRITSLIALLPSALGAGGGLKVDGSGTALPVSGTVTANAGTNTSTAALALETGGNLATIASDLGAKTDAANTATDTTSVSGISIWKQVSKSVQAMATSLSGTLTVAAHAVTNAGTFAVQAAQAGTWNIGSITTLPALPAGTNNIGTVNSQTVPTTTGGLSTYHLAAAASTNATNIKASAGQLYGYMISNTSAAYSYVAFHNSASAPTAGASIFFKIGIPAGGAANVEFSNGVAFSSGIGITTVTGAADSSSTAVAANDLIINVFYK